MRVEVLLTRTPAFCPSPVRIHPTQLSAHHHSELIADNDPRVAKALQDNGIEISLIALNWFLTAFTTVSPLHTTMRIFFNKIII